jgi:hypothetical protein
MYNNLHKRGNNSISLYVTTTCIRGEITLYHYMLQLA